VTSTDQETDMAISAHFRHRGFTPEKYDEAIRRLEAAGHGKPAGRLISIAVEADGEIEVFAIWESPEALEAFGSALVPLLQELGVEAHPPTIHPVRNIIKG
jgi:hypothetical protein